ncbi:hypothetical protein [Leifsonia aquatica]|uniref:hypothetical protein n=1 Tax=Leifsonia aquatica TaxID=144185 RepID=UPI000468054B|nr:hypothetical protein [Leifsonia aquatica]
MTQHTITIDRDRAIELMERAVAEKGADYVYDLSDEYGTGIACFYVRGGKPSCIVGHALHYAGVDIETLVELDSPAGYSSTSIESIIENDRVPGLSFTAEARAALRTAQSAQDLRETWGHSLDLAKEASQ